MKIFVCFICILKVTKVKIRIRIRTKMTRIWQSYSFGKYGTVPKNTT
jgi:hypothetical protein